MSSLPPEPHVTPGEFALDGDEAPPPMAVVVGFGELAGPVENVKVVGLNAADRMKPRPPAPAGEFFNASHVGVYDENGVEIGKLPVGGDPVYTEEGEVAGWDDETDGKTEPQTGGLIPVTDAAGKIIRYVDPNAAVLAPAAAPAEPDALLGVPVGANGADASAVGEAPVAAEFLDPPPPTPLFPQADPPPEPQVAAARADWGELTLAERVELLADSVKQLAENEPEWVGERLVTLERAVGESLAQITAAVKTVAAKVQQLEGAGGSTAAVDAQIQQLNGRISTLVAEMGRATGVNLRV